MPNHLKRHSFTGDTDHNFTGLDNNYLPKLNSSGTGITNSQIYDDGTSVGIGTTTLGAKLDVRGTTGSGELLFQLYSTDWATPSERSRFTLTQGASLIRANTQNFYASDDLGNVNAIFRGDNASINMYSPSLAATTFSITNSNRPLISAPNSSQIATTSNWMFGINSTPQEIVHISGGTIRIQTVNATEGAGKLAVSDANGSISFSSTTALGLGTVGGTGTPGTISKWATSTTLTDSLITETGTGVTVNGSIYIYGNVDVLGTATTFNTQTVQTADNNITMNLSGSHLSSLYGGINVLSGRADNISSTWTINAAGDWSANTPGHFTGLRADSAGNTLRTYNSAGTNTFVVQDGGNVGINTTSPLYRFQVNSTTAMAGTPIAYFRNSGDTASVSLNDDGNVYINSPQYTGLQWQVAGVMATQIISTSVNDVKHRLPTNWNWVRKTDDFILGGKSGDNWFFQRANSSSITPTAKVHIQGNTANSSDFSLKIENSANTISVGVRDDGNVGIGPSASSPQEKLHVSGGTIRINTANSTEGAGKLAVSDVNGSISFSSTTALNLGGSGFSGWTASTGLNSIIANNGSGNLASGNFSVVGGSGNTSTGVANFIGAGKNNYSSGNYSNIVGGQANIASGPGSFVGGGRFNEATGQGSVAVGGGYTSAAYANRAIADFAFIGAGRTNVASGITAIVVGGNQNTAGGNYSFVGGGSFNVATGNNTAIAGGKFNEVTYSNYGTIGGGYDNTVSGAYGTVAGGRQNSSTGSLSFIGGGSGNQATANYSTVGGGNGNQATFAHATIAGGQSNTASGYHSFIGGGNGNITSTSYSSVLNGTTNTASGIASSVLAGTGHTVTGNNSAVIGGSDITAVSADTVYVPSLNIKDRSYNIAFVSSATSTTTTIDWATNNVFDYLLSAATTFTLSNPIGGQTIVVAVRQNGTGGFNYSFSGSTVFWPGGTVPTITTTANKTDIYTFVSLSGNAIYGSALTNF